MPLAHRSGRMIKVDLAHCPVAEFVFGQAAFQMTIQGHKNSLYPPRECDKFIAEFVYPCAVRDEIGGHAC